MRYGPGRLYGAALGIIVAALQLATGKIGFEAAFLIVFLSQEFFLPMRRLGSLFHTAMNGMAASRRMFGILDTPEPERGDVELDGRGDIELAGVSYAYGDRTVLDSANATIAHGSLVALVGESGGGKSTLAGIIAGRKGAYRGSVRIGGVELRDATADSLMRAVTLVPTNGYLFAGTLRDNLLLAQPNATDTELLRALDRTRVAAFVQANGGLDMVINEGGTNLSGGQRQRVCMARALLHDSPIYVFDEATSNVDAASETAIGEVIASLARRAHCNCGGTPPVDDRRRRSDPGAGAWPYCRARDPRRALGHRGRLCAHVEQPGAALGICVCGG